MDLQRISGELQTLVDRTHRRQKLIHSIAVGVAYPDADFRWSAAAGVADPAEGRRMQEDTPFLIASVTKMFTAAAIMMLRERGRLTLADRVTTCLPSTLVEGLHRHRGRDYTGSLTIGHLVSHTSGLPDYFLERPKGGRSVFHRILAEGDRAWDLEEVLRYTREQLPPAFPPAPWEDDDTGRHTRVRAHYSDTNYKLLGAIIEAVANQPLNRVFEELFFEPLDLRQTYLYGHRRSTSSGEPARVYHRDRPFAFDQLMRSHGAEGGIVSTLDDTIRFGRALMTGELFASGGTLDSMQRWNPIFFPLQYGYGLMRFKLSRLLSPFGFSPDLIGHSGSSGSFLFHCRELNLYLSGTVNQMTLQRAPFPLMIRIARIFERALR